MSAADIVRLDYSEPEGRYVKIRIVTVDAASRNASNGGAAGALTASVVLRASMLAVLYFAAAKLGLSLEVAQGNATPVWAPTALALVAMLLFGPRMWVGVFAGAFVANATTPIPVWAAFAIAVGNTLEAVVGYKLLRWARFDVRMSRLRDVMLLVALGAGISTLVSATIGVTSLLIAGEIDASQYLFHWRVWWLGDAMGDVLLAPVLLSLARARDLRWRPQLVVEAIGMLMAIVLTGVFVFRNEAPVGAYVTFPIVMWATLRFRQLGAAITVCVATGFGIAAIISGASPFGTDATEAVAILQALMALLAVSSLSVAAVLSERDAASARYREEAAIARESERQLAEAQAVAHLGSWEWDIAVNEVRWSEEMFRIYGYEPFVFNVDFEKAMRDVVPEDAERISFNTMASIEAAVQGDVPDIEYRIVRPDGELRHLYGRGRLLCGADGKPTRMLGTVQDVTEIKRAEMNAKRLAEVEESHRQAMELNDRIVQGLTAAKLALELDRPDRALDALRTTLGRARGLVSDLLRRTEIRPGDLVKPSRPSTRGPRKGD